MRGHSLLVFHCDDGGELEVAGSLLKTVPSQGLFHLSAQGGLVVACKADLGGDGRRRKDSYQCKA